MNEEKGARTVARVQSTGWRLGCMVFRVSDIGNRAESEMAHLGGWRKMSRVAERKGGRRSFG
jgi:hypothetical protein